jgi:hypothetical protein
MILLPKGEVISEVAAPARKVFSAPSTGIEVIKKNSMTTKILMALGFVVFITAFSNVDGGLNFKALVHHSLSMRHVNKKDLKEVNPSGL